jgi:hypothetical protein
MPCLARRFGFGVVAKSGQASARLDVSLREIVTFEQQRRPVRLCAGVGEAVGEIEPRRMPTFSVSLEAGRGCGANGRIDGRFLDIGVPEEGLEPRLGIKPNQ